MPQVLPPESVRVLHLTIAMARGGRRDAILTLARAGRRHGITSYLATLRGDSEETAAFSDAFSGVADLVISGLPSPAQLRHLRDLCREWGIQIVHAHDASSQFVASMLRLVAPALRIVMTYHRSLGFESAGFRNRFRNATSLLAVSRVITASHERRRHFLSENWVPSGKVGTIPLGIDLSRFTPDPAARREIRAELGLGPDMVVAIAAGHYGEEKGIDLAIESFGHAVSAGAANACLVVMGTGTPDRVEWMTQRAQSGPGRVLLLGQRSDPERVLAAADLMVHTPRLEAFGLVVVQAMATALPVVAFEVGGLPEIVQDGVTGLLTPLGDTARAGECMGRLIAEPSLRNQLGEAALTRARTEYTEDRYAERHRALYQSLGRSA